MRFLKASFVLLVAGGAVLTILFVASRGAESGGVPRATVRTPAAPIVPEAGATALVDVAPVTGVWQFHNVPGVVDCEATQFPLRESAIESGHLAVAPDASAITVTGYGPAALAFKLSRDFATPAQALYTGRVNPAVLRADLPGTGASSITFTMLFESPTRLSATLEGILEVDGLICSVDRAARASLAER